MAHSGDDLRDHTAAQVIDEQVIQRLLANIEHEYRKLAANGAPFQITIHASAGANQCDLVSQQTQRTKIA